jgi:hypothetical protein
VDFGLPNLRFPTNSGSLKPYRNIFQNIFASDFNYVTVQCVPQDLSEKSDDLDQNKASWTPSNRAQQPGYQTSVVDQDPVRSEIFSRNRIRIRIRKQSFRIRAVRIRNEFEEKIT